MHSQRENWRHRDTSIVFRISLLLAMACYSGITNAEAMFTVTRYAFCRSVVDHEAKQVYSDPADVKPGETLYLWMEIAVNELGLKYLKSFGRLPVFVAWGKDKHLVMKPVDIGIKAEDWSVSKEKSSWEYSASGSSAFKWRTQATRVNLVAGQHYVSVLDPNRKPVVAEGEGSDAFRPEISINLLKR
jgi:hypothetical protein